MKIAFRILQHTAVFTLFFLLSSIGASAQEKVAGNKGSRKANMSFSVKKGEEIGVKIKAGRKEARLKKFTFRLDTDYRKQARFKVNVYDLQGAFPGKNIATDSITSVIPRTGEPEENGVVVVVDLTPYKLSVKGDFLISIEWLETLPGNGPLFSSGLLNGGTWLKNGTGEWKKLPVIGASFQVGLERQ
ncbi:MAG: hypothetical protein INR69_12105 [Mucilaginibacter polytrichastri]|nr:hypothetical protein [Mucilaginibacter polytrichastri]